MKATAWCLLLALLSYFSNNPDLGKQTGQELTKRPGASTGSRADHVTAAASSPGVAPSAVAWAGSALTLEGDQPSYGHSGFSAKGCFIEVGELHVRPQKRQHVGLTCLEQSLALINQSQWLLPDPKPPKPSAASLEHGQLRQIIHFQEESSHNSACGHRGVLPGLQNLDLQG